MDTIREIASRATIDQVVQSIEKAKEIRSLKRQLILDAT